MSGVEAVCRVKSFPQTDTSRGGTVYSSLCPDRVEVRTFDHTANQWLPHLDRTITPPRLP